MKDGLSALLVSLYIFAVIFSGNTTKFINELKTEKGFMKFGLSIFALVIIKDELKLGTVGELLIDASLLALFLNISAKNENFLDLINTQQKG
jgi:hypothetical protein